MPGGHVGSIAIEDTAGHEAGDPRWAGAGRRSRARGGSSTRTSWSRTAASRRSGRGRDAADAQVVDAAGTLVLPGLRGHPPPHLADGDARHLRGLDAARLLPRHPAPDLERLRARGRLRRQLRRRARGARLRRHDAARLLPLPELARACRRGGARAARRGRARRSSPTGCSPCRCEQPAFATPEDRLADARRVRERYFSSGGGLLDMGVALTELGLVPFDVTRAEVALARELDVMVTAHTGSVTSDRRARPRSSCSTPPGCSTTARCTCTATPAPNHELDLLADAGASVSLTPETELQMGMGFPIFARALERGPAAQPRLRHRLQQPRRPVRPDAARAPGGARRARISPRWISARCRRS